MFEGQMSGHARRLHDLSVPPSFRVVIAKKVYREAAAD